MMGDRTRCSERPRERREGGSRSGEAEGQAGRSRAARAGCRQPRAPRSASAGEESGSSELSTFHCFSIGVFSSGTIGTSAIRSGL